MADNTTICRYLAKLAAPLCVNLLMMLHMEDNQRTVFDRVAGKGMQWAFVDEFLHYFPCVILVLCIMNFFEVYSKFMKVCGLDDYTYYDFYDLDRLEAGKQILEEERRRLSRHKPRTASQDAAMLTSRSVSHA
jgi:hypothetical protein